MKGLQPQRRLVFNHGRRLWFCTLKVFNLMNLQFELLIHSANHSLIDTNLASFDTYFSIIDFLYHGKPLYIKKILVYLSNPPTPVSGRDDDTSARVSGGSQIAGTSASPGTGSVGARARAGSVQTTLPPSRPTSVASPLRRVVGEDHAAWQGARRRGSIPTDGGGAGAVTSGGTGRGRPAAGRGGHRCFYRRFGNRTRVRSFSHMRPDRQESAPFQPCVCNASVRCRHSHRPPHNQAGTIVHLPLHPKLRQSPTICRLSWPATAKCSSSQAGTARTTCKTNLRRPC